jgi:hypothetical protein
MKNGFIKIDKRILEWGWYQDSNTFRLWIHLLLKANWKDKKFQSLLVKRGQLVTSVKNLSKDLELTTQQIRTSLKKLKETKEISEKTTNKFTLINIENYCLYQDNKEKNNKQITNEQQTNNKQITTIEDIKERKNNINPYIPLNSSKAETSGVEKQVSWEVNDIINALDDKSLQLAKIHAPGWDVYHLAGVYVDGINSGIREKPRSIKAAFPRWCKLYTKGTPP